MSGSSVFLRAPGKINWTLEVLGKREDGYHEVRTILQTLDVSDWLEVIRADEMGLELGGVAGPLAATPRGEGNLALRAARLLRERTGGSRAALLMLQKRVPVAAGLGGGSSDAGATLLGLRRLWQLDLSDDELGAIASELGSDVPFFLRGGTALATGRGDVITPLPDVTKQHVVVAGLRSKAPYADKTARMYAALRPEHYTDGSRTERLASRLRAGEPARDEDLFNVFEAVLPEVDPEAARLFDLAEAFDIGRPHLVGAGPAFFFLTEAHRTEGLMKALDKLGLQVGLSETLPAAEAGFVTSAE